MAMEKVRRLRDHPVAHHLGLERAQPRPEVHALRVELEGLPVLAAAVPVLQLRAAPLHVTGQIPERIGQSTRCTWRDARWRRVLRTGLPSRPTVRNHIPGLRFAREMVTISIVAGRLRL